MHNSAYIGESRRNTDFFLCPLNFSLHKLFATGIYNVYTTSYKSDFVLFSTVMLKFKLSFFLQQIVIQFSSALL